jgi:hypothetical protein
VPIGRDIEKLRLRCPRGMIAVSITPEMPTLAENVDGRGATAWVARETPVWSPGSNNPGITVTCIEGRLIRP